MTGRTYTIEDCSDACNGPDRGEEAFDHKGFMRIIRGCGFAITKFALRSGARFDDFETARQKAASEAVTMSVALICGVCCALGIHADDVAAQLFVEVPNRMRELYEQRVEAGIDRE